MNIPNLIISSLDSIYDQFQMVTEIFKFDLEKYLSHNFHNENFMIIVFLTKNLKVILL